MQIKGSIPVRYRGYPVSNLNELELVGSDIYANVFMTDCVIKIDASNGEVRSWIRKGSEMYQTVNPGVDVMNGIAYDHETSKLYVTGKNWPHLYEVIVTSDGATDNTDLDHFCLHRSMSLADFSVMVTLMRELPTSSSSTMPGLETTTVTSSSPTSTFVPPSSDQIRTYFEAHQSYFQLPIAPRSLIDIALDTNSSDEPAVDKLIQLQFQESLSPIPSVTDASALAPLTPNDNHPSRQDSLNPL